MSAEFWGAACQQNRGNIPVLALRARPAAEPVQKEGHALFSSSVEDP